MLSIARLRSEIRTFSYRTDWQIRHRVAQALGHFQTPEAKATLEKLAHDDAQQVAELARSVL